MDYYVYMVLCGDGSIYTGTAKEYLRRIGAHATHAPECAKYTRSRNVASVVGLWRCDSKSSALKYEYAIKRLSHAEKVRLTNTPSVLGVTLLDGISEAIPTPLPLPTLEECIEAVKSTVKI